MRVLEFNYGSRGIGHIFRNLGISTGYYFDQFISMSTKKRILCSIRHSSHATKWFCTNALPFDVVILIFPQIGNLAEDLMVDGETYECVKSFCSDD